MWFPTYFSERRAASGGGAAPPPPAPPGSSVPGLDAFAFLAQLAVALSNLPGNALSLYLVDVVGRRRTLAGSLTGGAASALLFAFAPSGGGSALSLAAACIFNGVSVAAWNSLDTYSAEVLPTSLRATGLGLFSAAGRAGSIMAQYSNGALLPLAQWAPLLLGAGAMLASATAVAALPQETAGQSMADEADAPVSVAAAAASDGDTEGLVLLAHPGR